MNPPPRINQLKRLGAMIALLGVTLGAIPAYAQVTAPPPSLLPGITIHVVQRGEDLFQIAREYGTTVDAIAEANGLSNTALIQVGERLVIPDAVSSSAPNAAPPGAPTQYVVGPGDSLWALSERYSATIQQIAAQNHIVNPDAVYVGLPLAIPAGASGNEPVSTGNTYVVQPGDTLFGIAAATNQPLDLLASVNNLSPADPLFPGQALAVPGSKDAPALIDAPAPVIRFTMHPAVAEQGRSFALTITTTTPTKLSGTFLNHPLNDNSPDNGLTHYILIGTDAFTTPGIYLLQLTATDQNGKTTDLSRNFEIADGGYGSEQINLPPDLKDLADASLAAAELAQIAPLTSKASPKRYFDHPFGLPVPAAIVSQFGTRRSYDGGPYNQFHSGTDFAGAPGTPIYAPLGGVVVFTGPMRIRGNMTIIDHGWGVYTAYCHQSEILVNVGQVVQPGQLIGKIGATGRVTGPHLHWEVYVNGVPVDPLQWARTAFP